MRSMSEILNHSIAAEEFSAARRSCVQIAQHPGDLSGRARHTNR